MPGNDKAMLETNAPSNRNNKFSNKIVYRRVHFVVLLLFLFLFLLHVHSQFTFAFTTDSVDMMLLLLLYIFMKSYVGICLSICWRIKRTNDEKDRNAGCRRCEGTPETRHISNDFSHIAIKWSRQRQAIKIQSERAFQVDGWRNYSLHSNAKEKQSARSDSAFALGAYLPALSTEH